MTTTLLGSVFNTNSGTKTVTATPAVGDLIIIVVEHTGSIASVLPTDNNADGLGAYTLIPNSSALKASSVDSMSAYVRNDPIGNASSTTFSHAPGTTTGGGIHVFKTTSISKVSLDAIRQAKVQSNQAAAGTPAPVFSSAPLTTNGIIGVLFNATSPATMTPRTSFTEVTDVGYSTPTTGVEAMVRDSGETTTTQTWGGASASAFCSLIIEINGATNSLAETLSDNFDDNSIDVTKWTTIINGGATVFETSQQMQITPAVSTLNSEGDLVSLNYYDLTGSYGKVKVVQVASASISETQLSLISANSLEGFILRQLNGNLVAGKVIGGSITDLATIAYNAVTMLYWRIRESGGTTFFEYSADDITYTQLTSLANPFAIKSMQAQLAVLEGGTTASPGTAIFDNYNIVTINTINSGFLRFM